MPHGIDECVDGHDLPRLRHEAAEQGLQSTTRHIMNLARGVDDLDRAEHAHGHRGQVHQPSIAALHTRSLVGMGGPTPVGNDDEVRFGYAVDKRLIAFWLPFGLRPATDGVTLTPDAKFVATFGFFKIETPLSNIDGAHITRNYRWWTAVGVRGSFVDDGLTFGTNADAGVCVHFREPVPSPMRRKGHSALTVTVADLDGLVARTRPGRGLTVSR